MNHDDAYDTGLTRYLAMSETERGRLKIEIAEAVLVVAIANGLKTRDLPIELVSIGRKYINGLYDYMQTESAVNAIAYDKWHWPFGTMRPINGVVTSIPFCLFPFSEFSDLITGKK